MYSFCVCFYYLVGKEGIISGKLRLNGSKEIYRRVSLLIKRYTEELEEELVTYFGDI